VLASPAPKITPVDAMIDFGFPAHHVRNFVRGLSSIPGAYTFFRGSRIIILKCTELKNDNVVQSAGQLHPGTIIPHRKRLIVQCADSAVEILELKPQGKKKLDGISFINGYRPLETESFGNQPEGVRKR
jgi:methionyl-tRNA formyltransferase